MRREQQTPAVFGDERAEPAVSQRLDALATRGIRSLEGDGGWIALCFLSIASIAVGLYLSRRTTFFLDEFSFFENSSEGFAPGVLLAPHSGELALLPQVLYTGVLDVFGPDYLVFRLIAVLGSTMVASFTYALLRPRLGGAIALAPALVLLFFASSTAGLLSPVGIPLTYSVAASLAALYALDRGGRYSDPLACFCLVVASAWWTFGTAASAGVGVGLIARRESRRRVWIAVLPLVLVAVWYLLRSHFVGVSDPGGNVPKASDLLQLPVWAVRSLAAAVAATTGLYYDFSPGARGGFVDTSFGAPILLALVALAALRLRGVRPTRTLITCVSMLLCFWLFADLVQKPGVREPGLDRYVYVAAPVLYLVVAELLGGSRWRPSAAALILAGAVLALGTHLYLLRDYSSYLRDTSANVRADLTAIELARDRLPPHFVPTAGQIGDTVTYFVGYFGTAQKYLAAADEHGSFAYTLRELSTAPETARENADQVLANALALKAAPARQTTRRGCRVAGGSGFRLPRGGAVVRSARTGSLALRRFGDSYTAAVGQLAQRRFIALRIPADVAAQSWYGQLSAGGRVMVCPLADRG